MFQVPFANISINLARLLTGQLRQSSFEDDVESENDGVMLMKVIENTLYTFLRPDREQLGNILQANAHCIYSFLFYSFPS